MERLIQQKVENIRAMGYSMHDQHRSKSKTGIPIVTVEHPACSTFLDFMPSFTLLLLLIFNFRHRFPPA